ncbi:MAG: outer membrane beta-barrel protein [Devosia sp.]
MFRSLLLGAGLAAVALVSLPALAADMPSGMVIAPDVSDADSPAYNWDGFYATLFAVHAFGYITDSDGVGVSVGVDKTEGNLLFGATVSAAHFSSGSMTDESIFQAVGRAGVLLGDRVALFGLAGLGWETYHDAAYIPVGAGVELGLVDHLSLRLQYQANYITAKDAWTNSLSSALVFHF